MIEIFLCVCWLCLTGDLKVLQRSLNHGANLCVLGWLCGTADLLQLPLMHLDFLGSQGALGFGKSCPVLVTLNS